MSIELPFEDRIEVLRGRRDALQRAKERHLENYIEGLDQDESDLAFDQEDERDIIIGENLEERLEQADELRIDLDDGDHDDPETGKAELEGELTQIDGALDDWARSLRDRGIEPTDGD